MSLPDDWLTNAAGHPWHRGDPTYELYEPTYTALLAAGRDVQPVLDGQVTVEVGAVPE